MFDETSLPMPEVDSEDEEYFPTADLDDLVWCEKSVPDSWEYLCIHQIPSPATPGSQPNQVEMPPEPENLDIDIPEDIPCLINVPEELLSDFDSWAHSVLENRWWYDIQ